VFGSFAPGDDGPNADIDMLVILRTVTRRHDEAVRVLGELRDPPVPVDVLVADEVQLQREASLPVVIRVAQHDGRVIERDSYRPG
jgi:predicted nucleotidyltransferase